MAWLYKGSDVEELKRIILKYRLKHRNYLRYPNIYYFIEEYSNDFKQIM